MKQDGIKDLVVEILQKYENEFMLLQLNNITNPNIKNHIKIWEW